MAVQTRSPIARGNWVDIGNESKEQITRAGARHGGLSLSSLPPSLPPPVKWRTDWWVAASGPGSFVSARGWPKLKQRGVEAHFDERTEHDFTALTGDARNALDNPHERS